MAARALSAYARLISACCHAICARKPSSSEVLGDQPSSVRALSNLKRICDGHISGEYEIEVIDLLQNPKLAAGDQILAIPTLVRRLPQPMRKIIGDLSDAERVLVGLDLRDAE